jgi:hypothetical protein
MTAYALPRGTSELLERSFYDLLRSTTLAYARLGFLGAALYAH